MAVVAIPVAGQSLSRKPDELCILAGELGEEQCLVVGERSFDHANNFDDVFARELNDKWYLPDRSNRMQRSQKAFTNVAVVMARVKASSDPVLRCLGIDFARQRNGSRVDS